MLIVELGPTMALPLADDQRLSDRANLAAQSLKRGILAVDEPEDAGPSKWFEQTRVRGRSNAYKEKTRVIKAQQAVLRRVGAVLPHPYSGILIDMQRKPSEHRQGR